LSSSFRFGVSGSCPGSAAVVSRQPARHLARDAANTEGVDMLLSGSGAAVTFFSSGTRTSSLPLLPRARPFRPCTTRRNLHHDTLSRRGGRRSVFDPRSRRRHGGGSAPTRLPPGRTAAYLDLFLTATIEQKHLYDLAAFRSKVALRRSADVGPVQTRPSGIRKSTNRLQESTYSHSSRCAGARRRDSGAQVRRTDPTLAR